MNKAILIISVGTSETAALEATTMRMQQDATEKFGLPCYVAYSSKFILKRRQEKETGEYLGIADAVTRMKADGIEEAYVQPTYLLNGVEMEDMTAQITEAAGTDFSVKISRPLLMGKPDYIQALEHILDDVKLTEEEALGCIRSYTASHVMFGTDHPMFTPGFDLDYFFRLPLTEEERRAILSGTAQCVFGFTAPWNSAPAG